jgi:hypothetical protein
MRALTPVQCVLTLTLTPLKLTLTGEYVED